MRYHSLVMDSARWEGFEFRPDDIVISTPPKCGTTWTQMLVALLVFDGPVFPDRLDQISPWLDMCNRTVDEVFAALDAHKHRRFIKTHTPLDGLPWRDDISYVVVARDPRDVFISFEHHRDNMDVAHFLARRAATVGMDDLAEIAGLAPPPEPDPDPAVRFRQFLDDVGTVGLASILHHLNTGWQRRAEPNVLLCHYADYLTDLPTELARLAAFLKISLTTERARELADEAGFDKMRARATDIAPNVTDGNWKDNTAFFRKGTGGEWRDRVSDKDLAHYEQRVAGLIEPELAAWVHHGRHACGLE